jgi:hypothetical protein
MSLLCSFGVLGLLLIGFQSAALHYDVPLPVGGFGSDGLWMLLDLVFMLQTTLAFGCSFRCHLDAVLAGGMCDL